MPLVLLLHLLESPSSCPFAISVNDNHRHVWELQIFLYGGYYKDALAEKDGTEKGVVHADMWVLDPRTWEWNKVCILETSIERLYCSSKPCSSLSILSTMHLSSLK